MKLPTGTSFRLNSKIWKESLYFLESADFEASNKKDNTIKRKVTIKRYEQVPDGVSVYKMGEVDKPSFFESFGINCVRIGKKVEICAKFSA